MRIVAAILLGIALNATAQVPDGHLRVTVQQRESGKLDPGLHLLDLVCIREQCLLTTTSLNQCSEWMGVTAFSPTVERSSTSQGDLSVVRQGATLVVTEKSDDLGGESINTFRFSFKPDPKWVTELTDFSGAFVKNSRILNRVITVEFVPLPKRSQVVKLDCGVYLPGLEK